VSKGLLKFIDRTLISSENRKVTGIKVLFYWQLEVKKIQKTKTNQKVKK